MYQSYNSSMPALYLGEAWRCPACGTTCVAWAPLWDGWEQRLEDAVERHENHHLAVVGAS